ncbi:hypothetical protein IMCC3317_33200 [Kordia antarctica]|uniref:Uncharacterized protein n=1 Tax=Kordia antarctica TaxID=1218801 RepID=A0A7L4ZN81_9FLAO|nr:hypothetical protein [Kordia antarctica]QHI37937.1 hypothetical protein IMCC3317_33200 [Kordia antarctica]
MILLKDYIGKIYKEITNAKVQSDIETLVIANEYANNPMLKHFSVPNIRIKNMELTIPVAVDATQSTSRPYTEREVKTAFIVAFNASFLSFYPDKQDTLDSLAIDVAQAASGKSTAAASELKTANTPSEEAAPTADSPDSTKTADGSTQTTASSESTQKYETAVNKVAYGFAEVSYRFVDTSIPQDAFYAVMIPEVESRLAQRPLEIQELPVIIETQKLKLINDPASMINIKVSITDDAMEWTTDIDENGETRQVLNYE